MAVSDFKLSHYRISGPVPGFSVVRESWSWMARRLEYGSLWLNTRI
jgi:hypothetical protein